MIRGMLAIQTAQGVRLAPFEQVASLTPVRPNRTRVVLCDGTVGHLPGDPPEGPWVRLGPSWLCPQGLVRDGDSWRDPADYLYPYQPLETAPEVEDESELAPTLQSFHRENRKVFWRTDSGDEPCPTPYRPTLVAYPELLDLGTGVAVNPRRVRALIPGMQFTYLELDNGTRLLVQTTRRFAVRQAFGCDSFEAVDASVPKVLHGLRDLPYDLATASAERLRQDFPRPRWLVLNVVWQAVLQGQPFAGGLNDFYFQKVLPLLQRVGGEFSPKEFISEVWALYTLELILVRELGLSEPQPNRRQMGERHPLDWLLAPWGKRREALAAVAPLSMSVFFYLKANRLELEFLAWQLQRAHPGRVRLFLWGKVPPSLRANLESCGLEVSGEVRVHQLQELEALLQQPPPPPPPKPPPPLWLRRLAVQVEGGLLFIPFAQVASLTPVAVGRIRVVRNDGSQFYRPGPMPDGPWVALGESRVRPEHLRRVGEQWEDPGGLRYPLAALANAPAVETAPEDQVLRLQNTDAGCRWVTDAGQQDEAGPAELAAAKHSGLVRVGRGLWVNRHRLECTRMAHLYVLARLDDGFEFRLHRNGYARHLAQALGLADPARLPPYNSGYFNLQIRDYPYEIATAPAAVLRRDFTHPRQLMANVAWQSFTIPGLGYGTSFSDFFYMPLQIVLHRAGFLPRAALTGRSLLKDRLKLLFQLTMLDMAWKYRFFTYREFGFEDENPQNRVIGQRRPDVLLVVEKGDLLTRYGHQLQKQYGVSLHITDGNPKMLDTEYLAEDLLRAGISEIEGLFYGDYDVGAWGGARGLVKQLLMLGIRCRRRRHLVWPHCFRVEELVLHSQPIEAPHPSFAAKLARWMQETGGIAGQPRAIHANWLQPYERVLERFGAMLEGVE